MKKLLACFASVTIIGIVIVAWAVKSPMTLCLTFDDDQNAHATIAGPTLEKYGWRGAFNIVTGRLEHPRAKRKMTWAQARELLAHGHEIYPHSLFPDPESKTFSHYNLCSLAEMGDIEAVERQVYGSKKMIEERLGVTPKYFCLPFNQSNEAVYDVIIKSGMYPMTGHRRNFPTHPGSMVFGDGGIGDFVMHEYRDGRIHIDIMIHGIIRDEGWEPFEDGAHFIKFCDELKQVENKGIVKIVLYSQAHEMSDETFLHKVKRKVRRLVFVVLAYAGII